MKLRLIIIFMKKIFLSIFLICLSVMSSAQNFDDWSNEDLCRWIDAVIVPDPILSEIQLRELVCFSNSELNEVSIQEPYLSEHGTVFPSPKIKQNNHSSSGLKFIFNYKITL